MESVINFHISEKYLLRAYIDISNKELYKKFGEVLSNEKTQKKFLIILKAIEQKIANRTQYNREGKCDLGIIYAIKIDNHRFYTIESTVGSWRELFICRYGKKQSQTNDKKLTDTINSIKEIEIKKVPE